MSIAVIPARGGSKRLPRKNILPLGDQPMITYPINAAKTSGLFDRVVVSTENAEIAAIVEQAGAEVHRRSESLSTDTVGVVDVCLDVVEKLESEGHSVPWLCCIYATAAFITATDLNEAAAVFQPDDEDKPDGVMSVSEYNYYPHSALYQTDGGLTPYFPDLVNRSRSEIPDLLASNGTFYFVSTESLRDKRSFYVDRLAPYIIDKFRALDMDTPEDYVFATKIFSAQQEI